MVTSISAKKKKKLWTNSQMYSIIKSISKLAIENVLRLIKCMNEKNYS